MEENDENLKKKSHKLHTEKNKFSKKKGCMPLNGIQSFQRKKIQNEKTI